ncbi:MAG TPA: outer membrane beta-barrel protein [Cyclobacteriaceae bacterium]|nr:outer membrane beta-barrel protein [Cyclobacteriaceae bacterium]
MKLPVVLLCAVLAASGVYAQKRNAPPSMKSKGSPQEKFLNKQFWLGFKAGVNLTDPVVQARYAVLSPNNYNPGTTEKIYQSFNSIGQQATVEVTFYYKGISISAQPTYRSSKFIYTNNYSWAATGANLTLQYQHEQQLDFVDLPLLLKYEFTENKLRPYLQAGIYYSILMNATKGVTVRGTDNASGGTATFSNEPVVVGAKDLFANNWGLAGGVGLNYNLGNVRLVLDVTYYKGMSNIANVENRYSNDRLGGIGDTQDDLKTNNLLFSVGCLFPMRFLSNNYKSLD